MGRNAGEAEGDWGLGGGCFSPSSPLSPSPSPPHVLSLLTTWKSEERWSVGLIVKMNLKLEHAHAPLGKRARTRFLSLRVRAIS